MLRKKTEIYVLTLLLLAVAILIAAPQEVSFRLMINGGAEIIRPWKKSIEEYYMFLPSWADLEDLKLETPVVFDEVRFPSGASCAALEMNKPLSFSGREEDSTITFLRSENLGTMYIDTISGNTRYIRKKKGNREPGSLRLYTSEGELNAEGALNYIKARGNSTFTFAQKKAYSLELSAEVDLMGMGRAQKWILLADAFDPSHLRNKIVLDFAKEAGLKFTPECRWVELYLNGEYAGLYLLTERNEIHPQRVDVPGPTFLVSSEAPERMWEQELPHVTLDSGTALRIHQSDFEEQALKNLWQNAENAILAGDGIDPESGKHWSDLIDLDSWARKYLVEEIFANYDGGRLSQFYYLENGKICAGPVWDYDYAMVNHHLYNVPASNMVHVNQPEKRNGSEWFYRLCQDAYFYNYVLDLYKTEFRPILENLAERKIYEYSDIVSRAAWLDQTRWGTASPGEDMAVVQNFLSGRVDFLDEIWIHRRECILVEANCAGIQANYMVSPGDTLPPLPQREGFAWFYTGTDIPFDPGRPILEETAIELREID